MATTFLEPGGNATGDTKLWSSVSTASAVTVASQLGLEPTLTELAGPYVLSVGTNGSLNRTGSLADAGRRVSFWAWLTVFSASAAVATFSTAASAAVFWVRVGVDGSVSIERGGATLATSSAGLATLRNWHRISVSYVITSTTNFTIRVWIGDVLAVTATQANGSLVNTGTDTLTISDEGSSSYFHGIYVDDSAALTNPGNVYVVAKRPVLPPVIDLFDTTGGTGATDERPLSETNYKAHLATSQVTQQYNIEAPDVGDVTMGQTGSTILGIAFWAWMKKGSGAAGTPGLIYRNGAVLAVTLDTASAMYVAWDSTSFYGLPKTWTTTTPFNSSTPDLARVGARSSGAGADTFLYECGFIVSYIPAEARRHMPVIRSRAVQRASVI